MIDKTPGTFLSIGFVLIVTLFLLSITNGG